MTGMSPASPDAPPSPPNGMNRPTRRGGRRWPRALLALFGLLALAALALGQGAMRAAPEPSSAYVAGSSPQVLRGAETYDLVCSDCHGNSGLGIEEGRLSFLPEHRRCEQCHKRFNAPTKADVRLSERNAFDLGHPPALRGDGALEHFGTAAALYAYVRSAMPRYDPGALSDEAYLDITAFLLELNGALPAGTTLTVEDAAGIRLR